MQIQASFKCSEGIVCSGLEELCFLLKQIPNPCRYFDLVSTFARPVPEVCMTATTVLDWIYYEHGFRLTPWNQGFFLPVLAFKSTPTSQLDKEVHSQTVLVSLMVQCGQYAALEKTCVLYTIDTSVFIH